MSRTVEAARTRLSHVESAYSTRGRLLHHIGTLPMAMNDVRRRCADFRHSTCYHIRPTRRFEQRRGP